MASEQDVMVATQKAMRAIGELLATVEAMPASGKREIAIARTQFETALLWVASAADGGGVL